MIRFTLSFDLRSVAKFFPDQQVISNEDLLKMLGKERVTYTYLETDESISLRQNICYTVMLIRLPRRYRCSECQEDGCRGQTWYLLITAPSNEGTMIGSITLELRCHDCTLKDIVNVRRFLERVERR
jgi:hypothetical protein